MPLSHALTAGLLQAATLQDTIVTRMVPQRDMFDWTSGILQIVVLLLGAGMLVTLILLLLSVRSVVTKANQAIDHLTKETRPVIQRVTAIVDDAREMMAMVRTDVERVTDAAGAISDQFLDAADLTSRRIDEVNAVLDVLQAELESTAISTVSAIRGVRVGARTLSDTFGKRRRGGLRSAMPERDDIDGPGLTSRSTSGVATNGADDELLDDLDDEVPSA